MSRLGRNNYGGILTKGTTSERDAISSPSSGDLHYNTSTNQMNINVSPGPTLLAGAGGLTGTGSTQGIATESDYQPNNYLSFQATMAFNGTLSTTSDFWGSDDTGIISSSNPKWIRFEFPNDVAVDKYKIWPRAENGQHNPKTWKLFAYQHNSSTAVEIDSRTENYWNNTSTDSITNNTDYNEYTTTNTSTYRKYELRITDTHDPNSKYVKIGELAFYAPGNVIWKSLNLTIPPNQVALLSGATPPGSANNNNVFYKNTNPYNLQVYRNAWKILPLQLTNEPSFSFGTASPSQSSGNTGNVFYNTTNNSLNLRRNSEWFSILSNRINESILHTTYTSNNNDYIAITIKKDFNDEFGIEDILNFYDFENYSIDTYLFGKPGDGGSGGTARTGWMSAYASNSTSTSHHTRPSGALYTNTQGSDYTWSVYPISSSKFDILGLYLGESEFSDSWKYGFINYLGGGGGGGGSSSGWKKETVTTGNSITFQLTANGSRTVVDGSTSIENYKNGNVGNNGSSPLPGYPAPDSYTTLYGNSNPYGGSAGSTAMGQAWWNSVNQHSNAGTGAAGGSSSGSGSVTGSNGNAGAQGTWWSREFYSMGSTYGRTYKHNWKTTIGNNGPTVSMGGAGGVFGTDLDSNTHKPLTDGIDKLNEKYTTVPTWNNYKSSLNGGNGGNGGPFNNMSSSITSSGSSSSSINIFSGTPVNKIVPGGTGESKDLPDYPFFIIIKKT